MTLFFSTGDGSQNMSQEMVALTQHWLGGKRKILQIALIVGLMRPIFMCVGASGRGSDGMD
jgi:hypothetical protein